MPRTEPKESAALFRPQVEPEAEGFAWILTDPYSGVDEEWIPKEAGKPQLKRRKPLSIYSMTASTLDMLRETQISDRLRYLIEKSDHAAATTSDQLGYLIEKSEHTSEKLEKLLYYIVEKTEHLDRAIEYLTQKVEDDSEVIARLEKQSLTTKIHSLIHRNTKSDGADGSQ